MFNKTEDPLEHFFHIRKMMILTRGNDTLLYKVFLSTLHKVLLPYAFVVGSLMYAQTCTHLGVSFAVGMLGRFQSNLGWDHWVTTKKVM